MLKNIKKGPLMENSEIPVFRKVHHPRPPLNFFMPLEGSDETTPSEQKLVFPMKHPQMTFSGRVF